MIHPFKRDPNSMKYIFKDVHEAIKVHEKSPDPQRQENVTPLKNLYQNTVQKFNVNLKESTIKE